MKEKRLADHPINYSLACSVIAGRCALGARRRRRSLRVSAPATTASGGAGLGASAAPRSTPAHPIVRRFGRQDHSRRCLRPRARAAPGPEGHLGRQSDPDEAVHLGRRPPGVHLQRLRLLGLGVLRAPRGRSARRPPTTRASSRAGARVALGAGSPSTRTPATRSFRLPGSGSTPRVRRIRIRRPVPARVGGRCIRTRPDSTRATRTGSKHRPESSSGRDHSGGRTPRSSGRREPRPFGRRGFDRPTARRDRGPAAPGAPAFTRSAPHARGAGRFRPARRVGSRGGVRPRVDGGARPASAPAPAGRRPVGHRRRARPSSGKAVFVWRTSPVRGFSASTRTPTSIELRQAALTVAQNVTTSPTLIGTRNAMRSIAAVTTRRPECLIAARPAASSASFITVPPWTLPALFASAMLISLASIVLESEGDLGSINDEP